MHCLRMLRLWQCGLYNDKNIHFTFCILFSTTCDIIFLWFVHSLINLLNCTSILIISPYASCHSVNLMFFHNSLLCFLVFHYVRERVRNTHICSLGPTVMFNYCHHYVYVRSLYSKYLAQLIQNRLT